MSQSNQIKIDTEAFEFTNTCRNESVIFNDRF